MVSEGWVGGGGREEAGEAWQEVKMKGEMRGFYMLSSAKYAICFVFGVQAGRFIHFYGNF